MAKSTKATEPETTEGALLAVLQTIATHMEGIRKELSGIAGLQREQYGKAAVRHTSPAAEEDNVETAETAPTTRGQSSKAAVDDVPARSDKKAKPKKAAKPAPVDDDDQDDDPADNDEPADDDVEVLTINSDELDDIAQALSQVGSKLGNKIKPNDVRAQFDVDMCEPFILCGDVLADKEIGVWVLRLAAAKEQTIKGKQQLVEVGVIDTYSEIAGDVDFTYSGVSYRLQIPA